ncbi:ChaC-like protein-domain-containing protein [Clohesyomyces aquaticus]|uniref:glutathione-specific gamma-glutamylcyclotransferase n=1 Tax=Clohesyomyces aquaticus TaxID=1231657 RepID=A0A1Y1ZXU4_9PLEO|nr:ChaC-like protein-domain-containing protein [Clohesyomyces aquaticus]
MADAAQAAHEKETAEFGQDDDFWLFGYGSLMWKPPPHYDQRIPGYIEGYVRRFWQVSLCLSILSNESPGIRYDMLRPSHLPLMEIRKLDASYGSPSNTATDSEDHRGTPEAPGRVVTLIDRAHWETLTDHHTSTERVWGAAYHIPTAHVASVRAYLDIREINGYSIQFTPFHPAPYAVSISSPPATPEPASTARVSPPPTSTSQSTSTSAQPSTSGGNSSHRSTLSITARTTLSLHPSNSPDTPIKCLVYIGLPSNAQFLGPQDPEELARHILKSRGPSGENKEYLYALERSLLGLGRESEDRHVSDLVRRCRRLEVEEMGMGEGTEGEGMEGTEEKVGGRLRRVRSTEEQEEVEK